MLRYALAAALLFVFACLPFYFFSFSVFAIIAFRYYFRHTPYLLLSRLFFIFATAHAAEAYLRLFH